HSARPSSPSRGVRHDGPITGAPPSRTTEAAAARARRACAGARAAGLPHDRRESLRRGVHRRHRRWPDADRRVRRSTGSPRDSRRTSGLQDGDGDGAGGSDIHRAQALRAAAGVAVTTCRGGGLFLLAVLAPAAGRAQALQNATLRRAQQAYDNLEYRQALAFGQAALRERLAGAERARAYEVVAFSYAALDSILKAVDAFKQMVLIDPERQLDLSASPRWPNGDPGPAGSYTVVVEARLGQNTFSASQQIRVTHGRVDTLPHLTSLPGYQYLPETEIPAQTWRPLGVAFLYTGGALIGTLGLESGSLGASSKRELGVVGAAALVTGFVMTLRRPAPRPAEGNILDTRLLTETIDRRNA